MSPGGPVADIGIFGGSGFYELLDDAERIRVDTPYGPPSSDLFVGRLGDRRVAFLPRHGTDHRHPPHRINFRANIDAMRQAGVGAIFGPCASGSLREEVAPGDFVVLDQFVDRTWGRPDTYWDEGAPDHVTMADPYDAGLEDGPDAPAVSQDEVFAVFRRNLEVLRRILFRAVEAVPDHLLSRPS